MTANIRRTSRSGERVVARKPITPGPGNAENRIDLDDPAIFELAETRLAVDEAFKTLPAQQGAEASINFLSSSFSGVDLKVVAHLYDSNNWLEEKLEQLNSQRSEAQLVVDGCDNLINGGLDGLAQQQGFGDPSLVSDYAQRRELFIAATGLPFPGGAENDKAVNLLIGNILKGGNISFIGTARMKRQAFTLRQLYGAKVTEFTDRIDNLERIGAAGDGRSSDTVVLGTLQTISLQSFREKNAVRALGHSYAKGYTRGTRTIGGSMIFTIFNEHALADLIRRMGNSRTYGERDAELSTFLPDQLPPIDLTLVFANEYGALSDLRLYGVEFVTDGKVFSIEDLLSEGTMNYVCRDADIMTSRGRFRLSRLQRGMFNDKDDKDLTGSSLLFDNDAYNEHLLRLGVRRRLTNR